MAELVRNGLHLDADLAAHCTVVRSRGLRLVGDDIGEVFGPVPTETYVDSIQEDLRWILDGENLPTSPFYGVLNTCRVLMVLKHGSEVVPSREEAALWALGWAPSERRTLIQRCLDCYRSSAPVSVLQRPTHGHGWDRSQLLSFRDWERTIT